VRLEELESEMLYTKSTVVAEKSSSSLKFLYALTCLGVSLLKKKGK